MPVRLDVAMLVGVIMQSFFYGVFQVLFVACIYVLIYGRGSDRINWHFLTTAILMWILIGANFGLSWSRVMDGFIVLQPALANDPEAINTYFTNLSLWKEVARTGVWIVLTAVADALFIYRLYIVWGRNKYIIILPALLLCGSITAGIGIEVVVGTTSSGIFSSSLASWATSFFSISLVQNVITTSLIVYRIWRVNMSVTRGIGSQSLLPVMVIVLESGALYSSMVFVLLMTYVSNSYAQYIAIDMLVPIIGITFNLIIVRVGLGLSRSSSSGLKGPPSQPSNARYPLQTLNINVSRTVEHDVEGGSHGIMETKNGSVSDGLDEGVAWKTASVAI